MQVPQGVRRTRFPAARNQGIRAADGDAIAIIDDDEFAPREWLKRLADGLWLFGFDGVLGPVWPHFE